jgi:hypothetical protein
MSIERLSVEKRTTQTTDGGQPASVTTVKLSAPEASRTLILWVLVAVLASFTLVSASGVAAYQLWPDVRSVSQVLFLMSLVVPALIAFFGTYLIRSDMRDAITAGFIVAYLLMLLSAVGLSFGQATSVTGTLRDLLIQNFTGLMGVVIVFYFGSEAAIEVAKQVFASRVTTPAPNTPSASGGASAPAAHPAANANPDN